MSLLDDYLPDYDFSERHVRDVAARSKTIIAAAAAYRAESDPLFRAMIGLRELPMRLAGWLGGRQAEMPPTFSLDNFTLLERREGDAIVYGLVGQFWRSDFGLVPIADGATFRAFDTPGIAKLVLGFSAASSASGLTRLTTETRIHCPDPASRRKFAPYWYLIRPVSGLIRRRVLASIQRTSEKLDVE